MTGHNFILITRSTHREPPYLFCSRCGDVRTALAAGARSDETRDAAQSEGRQSGPNGNAQ